VNGIAVFEEAFFVRGRGGEERGEDGEGPETDRLDDVTLRGIVLKKKKKRKKERVRSDEAREKNKI
jgi:hypothetical protein